MTIMDATLLIVVRGVLLLALGVDLAALLGWLRRRWRREQVTKSAMVHPQAATAAGEFRSSPHQTIQLDCPNNANLALSRGRTALGMDRKQAAQCVLERNLACGCVRGAFQRQDVSHLSPDASACLLSPANIVQGWRASSSQGP